MKHISYNDFLLENPRYRGYSDNQDVKELFDFIETPTSVVKMIIALTNERPALAGIVHEVEELYGEKLNLDTNKAMRQLIGIFVRYVMSFYGYEPAEQKRLSRTRYFVTASHYLKTGSVKKSIMLNLLVSDSEKNTEEKYEIKIENLKFKGEVE